MATAYLTSATEKSDAPAMSPADAAAHAAASYVRPAPVDSDPSADEALRRVRGEQVPARTLTSYARRDVRNTMSRVRGW